MKNALLLLALACGPARASSTDTFVSVEAGPILNLDPAAIYDTRSLNAALNIYEPLLVFGTDPAKVPFKPFLAAEVPTKENGLLSQDGRTYAFPIRPGVLFHDGSPLTAEDVRYSLLRFMLSDFSGGPSAMLLEPVLGVPSTRDRRGRLRAGYREAAAAVTVAGDQVVVRLKKPDASFLAVLASWPMVLSKSWAVSQGEWDGSEGGWLRFNGRLPEQSRLRFAANGTGPFRVAGASPEVLTLERHDGFWRGPAALRIVVLRAVPCEMMRLALLETGDADHAELSRSSLRDAAQLPAVTIVDDLPSWSVGQTIFFSYRAVALGNQSLFSGRLDGKGIPSDFFSDPDLRRAFAHAFNYEVFLQQALRGKGERAYGPVPFERFSWKAPQPRFGYDRAKAVAHFKAAWKGRVWKKGFLAEIGYDAADPQALQVVDLLASELKAISPRFTLLPKPLRKSSLIKALRSRQLPIFVSGFEADYPDPHSYAFNLLHSEGVFPQAQGFGRKSLDAWVEKARMARPKDREAIYRNLQDLFDSELPQVYLYHPVGFRALRSNVAEKAPSNSLGPFTVHNAVYFYRITKE